MERVDMLLEPVRVFLVQVGEFAPKVLLALIILIAGWAFAKGVKFGVEKGLRMINFNVLTEKAGLDEFLQQGGGKADTTTVLGLLVYWLVILTAVMIAFNSLGLTHVTDLLGRVVLFVPKVIVAVLILAFGAYFARFIGATITTYLRNVGLEDADLLGRFAFYAILIFVLIIALDQMNLGDIIRQSFLVLLAAVAFGLALAFGLGGQKKAAELLEKWWPEAGGAGREGRE
ncbi:MAG: hypothetical protein HYU77_07540 [Betaproteobacteria bacterium]|nr:hypothetical protein [Betaproteobacteria bacterium]